MIEVRFILFALLLARPVFSQTVITLPIKDLNGPNGFAIDSEGTLYVANELGKNVMRIRHDSLISAVFNFDSPCGMDFDKSQVLFVSNFFSGSILRIKNNKIDSITRGIDKPSDIKFDKQGNLYISQYEKGNIMKLSKDGRLTIFASGFKNPFGLAFDKEGNLFVANNAGLINKVNSSGQVAFFARIPGTISYLAYSKKTQRLYVPCFTCHNLYAIEKNGTVNLIAGNGIAGYRDGLLNEARFSGPNSIAISPDGDLYVSEHAKNRIRKIINIE